MSRYAAIPRRRPAFFVGTLIALVVAVFVGAAAVVYASAPFLQPGVTWRQDGWLTGLDLHLMTDGRYAARPWCDICPIDIHYGRWTESGGLLELRPDYDAAAVMRLRRRLVEGCDALVQEWPAGDPHPSMTFFRDPDRCIDAK